VPVDLKKKRETFNELRQSSESSGFRRTCDEIEKYIMPRVGATSQAAANATAQGGQTWKDPGVWDSTAQVALTKLAAHVHMSATPPGLRWAIFQWLEQELQDDEDCRKAIEKRTDVLFQALEESDFNGELSSGYQEYLGLGNMIVVEEVLEGKPGEWGGFDYSTPPIRECEFLEDARGRMKELYRHLRWTPVQVIDKLGEEGIPKAILDKAKDAKGAEERLNVVFCIFERPEVLNRPVVAGQPKSDLVAAPELRPYGFVYFLLESGEQLGKEGGYYDFPAFIARWERVPGSRWGQGLGHQALPLVKSLNAVAELVLTALALEVEPELKATERALLSDLTRAPGKIHILEDLDEIARLLDSGSSAAALAAGVKLLEYLQGEVRRIFREDQLELKDSPQMTATEAQIRFDIMLKLLGPTFARLLSECLAPLLLGAYRALYRAGRFPEKVPQKVIDKGGELRIAYQGPMARSRRTDEVAAIERLASFVAGHMKLDFRRAALVYDDEEAVRQVAKLLEAPAGVLRTKAKVEELVKAQDAAEARAASASASKDEATAAEKLARAQAAGGGSLPAPTSIAAGAFPTEAPPALTPGGQVV
jgi:hypothetical protein